MQLNRKFRKRTSRVQSVGEKKNEGLAGRRKTSSWFGYLVYVRERQRAHARTRERERIKEFVYVYVNVHVYEHGMVPTIYFLPGIPLVLCYGTGERPVHPKPLVPPLHGERFHNPRSPLLRCPLQPGRRQDGSGVASHPGGSPLTRSFANMNVYVNEHEHGNGGRRHPAGAGI